MMRIATKVEPFLFFFAFCETIRGTQKKQLLCRKARSTDAGCRAIERPDKELDARTNVCVPAIADATRG